MISSSISQRSSTAYASFSSSSVHRVSLLRIFSLATLFLGVRSQLFPAVIELSSLDGTTGFALNGIAAGDGSGYSVSSAGDVNADGVADLIIGAWRADSPGRIDAGQSYVVFGKSGLGAGGTLELSSLDGTTGFALNGIAFSENSGISVSSAGDINGDGIDDLLIGAYQAEPVAGRAKAGKTYVVFGKSGLGSSGTLELSSLEGTTGFTLNGESSGDQSGYSVSSAGDVNGDVIDDLLIGALYANPASGRTDAGKAYVVFGKVGLGSSGILELSSLDGTTGFILNGKSANDRSGDPVSFAGDINGDGVDDLLIGAYGADPAPERTDAGRTYVVFGKVGLGSSGTLELSSLDGTTGFTLNGESADDQSGRSVSFAGDVNADGVDDLLIGARLADSTSGLEKAGKTYVVFGKSGLGSSGTLELSSLDGTTGFIINGESANDLSGQPVSSSGDVNGDGVDDLLIGASWADPGSGLEKAGKTYVVFGKSGLGNSGTLELSNLDGITGFTLNGEAASDYSGYSVSSAGDVNDDGVDDLLIGAYGADPASGRKDAGKTYVVFGRKASSTSVSAPSPSFTSTPGSMSIQSSTKTGSAQTSSFSLQEITSASSTAENFSPSTSQSSFYNSLASTPENSSLALALGIAGGVCALVSSIAAAVFAFQFRRRDSDRANTSQNRGDTAEVANSQYDNLPTNSSTNAYEDLHLSNRSHYVGGEELDEFNRQHDEYEAAQANMQ